jgi:GntR family transcriptional regulator
LHVSINTADGRPIYVQIMDEVRRALVVGTLHAEQMLPSVRQLAADLRLNPNTVAQAYRELEREGVVHVRRGQGTFVTERQAGEAERRELVHDVAERALLDAYRNRIGADELIEAIGEIAQTRTAADADGAE